jgi:hypothetical protein
MDWLTQMMQFGGPGQPGYGGPITPTSIFPPGQIGGAFPQYPALGQSLSPTSSATNAEGQMIDAQGNPIVAGGGGGMMGGGGLGGTPTGQGDASTPDTTDAKGGSTNRLLAGLRAVQAPARPDVVKPSTPHLPPLRPIQGGDLVAMLTSLGITPKDLMSVPTLGASLGRR